MYNYAKCIFFLNYYVEKKSETLSKRALQDSKDQMSLVSTNSCNSQSGIYSSEYLGPTNQSPGNGPIAPNVIQEAFPQQGYNRHFPSPSKKTFPNDTNQYQLSNLQQMLSILDSFIMRQYLVSHLSNNKPDACSSGASDLMSIPELVSFQNLSQPSTALITQIQSHINTLIASTTQSATPSCSEAHPHTNTSTTQSQQYPIVSTIPQHNRKHTRISSPPLSPPSSKRPKGFSPVSSDSEHNTPTTEAIGSQNNSSSSDNGGYSINDNTVTDKQETSVHNRIHPIKKIYAKRKYPTLMQDYLPNKYFDLFIVDTTERSCVNLENIGMLPNGSQACCVLIEGSSGVGKTMLLNHLAKQWGAGKIFTQYKLVFFLTFYDDDTHMYLYDGYDLFFQQLYDQQYMSREDNFLLLLDIHHQSHFPNIIFFFSQHFPKASIIFTCRSEWFHSEQDAIIQTVDQYLRVIGFNEESMQAMFTSCCPGLEQSQYWMKTHPFAAALTYRPLYCAMLIQLCRNSRLPESLPNITELYRLFILSSISLHVNKQINYYSELQDEDESTFKQLVASASKHVPQNISEKASFGLVKCSDSQSNRFVHPSIKEYFEALECCSTETKNYSFGKIFLAGLQKDCFLNGIEHFYERNDLLRLRITNGILFWLLFESQCSSSLVECLMAGLKPGEVPLEFRLEADPLEWYIIGWCLQNIQVETKLTCDVPYGFNRALCLEMLYNGTKHNPTSRKCKGRLTQITLNGDNQLSECLQWLTQMEVIENVLTLKIMGTLRSSVKCLNLDTYFPSLKTLDVTSHEVFSSVRPQLTISLPKLKHLTTLCIRTSQTSEFTSVKPDMLVSLADSIKTCHFLKILTFEGTSSQFLEFALTISSNDPIASSLQSLYILSSQCSDKLVMVLKSFLVLTNCKLK